MEKIPLPDVVQVLQESGNEATFEISPYFPGYGPTVGNALRRVLLSSLPGAAITAVQIEGIQHEFTAIPGVREDIVSLLLNLKRVRLKLEQDGPFELRLRAKGERVVRAGDIEKVAGVTVENPDHVLAHLTDAGARLDLVLTAERGRGYVPVELREGEERPLGAIAIDAIYTPVERVSFRVENVRVGQATDYHKLIVTIRTDGTLSPKRALEEAASVLQDHFTALAGDVRERLTYRREVPASELSTSQRRDTEQPAETSPAAPTVALPVEERLQEGPIAGAVRAPEERVHDVKSLPIVDFAASTRIQNVLEKEGIKTIAGLVQKTRSQLLGVPGLGEKALEEIEAALTKLGVSLREEGVQP